MRHLRHHLEPTGGTPPYSYSLDGGPFQSSNMFITNPGTHHITVKDSRNCTETGTFTISEFTYTFTNPTTPNCNNGTITFTSPLGSPPYFYNIGVGFFSNPHFTGLKAGTYDLEILDKNTGCKSEKVSLTLTCP